MTNKSLLIHTILLLMSLMIGSIVCVDLVSSNKIVLPENFDLKGDLTNLYVGDFNGDGKDDFLRQEKGDWAGDQSNTANVFLSAGDGTFIKVNLPESIGLNGDFTNLYIG